VSGESDDAPRPKRGAVRPPPSLAPDDAPPSVDVPRMDPPPPSLEAMVQSNRREAESEAGPAWWLWVLLVLAGAAVTAYVMR
jgi:hypothetical protein